MIDEIDIVFDFLFLPYSDSVVFISFEVSSGEYLVILPELFAEHLVAVDKVLAYAFADAVLALDSFLEQILEYMIVVGYVWVEVYGV